MVQPRLPDRLAGAVRNVPLDFEFLIVIFPRCTLRVLGMGVLSSLARGSGALPKVDDL